MHINQNQCQKLTGKNSLLVQKKMIYCAFKCSDDLIGCHLENIFIIVCCLSFSQCGTVITIYGTNIENLLEEPDEIQQTVPENKHFLSTANKTT